MHRECKQEFIRGSLAWEVKGEVSNILFYFVLVRHTHIVRESVVNLQAGQDKAQAIVVQAERQKQKGTIDGKVSPVVVTCKVCASRGGASTR